jgi:hypothetical protein
MTHELPPEKDESARRRAWLAASLVALLYLAFALPALRDYGPTWDCIMGEYPYGERLLAYLTGGGPEFLDLKDTENAPLVRAPHPDFDVARFEWFQVYPFGALLSAVSCRVLWTELGLVPALQAHNAVIPLLVAGLLLLLVRFFAPLAGLAPAVAGAALLVLCPVFFAHAENNLKDVPEACLYVAATVAGYAAFRTGRTRDWVALGVLTGLALAQKANALFLPVQLGVLFAAGFALPALRARRAFRWSTSGFAWAVLACLASLYAISPHFWRAPLGGPREMLEEIMRTGNHFFARGEFLGGISTGAVVYVLATTPPVVLALAAVGLLARGAPAELRLFLLCGLLVPIGRTLPPGMKNFDGVRHFIEFLPYLCVAAGLGLGALARLARSRAGPGALGRACAAALYPLALLGPAVQTWVTHPNGICYFNAFAGGLAGAQARGVVDATDFWGNSYWQGFAWLNEHAEPGASVIVPVASHIAESAAPVRKRADLALGGARPPVYVMYFTRKPKYRRLVLELEERGRPAHEILVQGAPILRIYRLADDPFGQEMLAIWKRQQSSRGSAKRFLAWVKSQPDADELMRSVRSSAPRKAYEVLLPRVPEDLRPVLEDIMWNMAEESP